MSDLSQPVRVRFAPSPTGWLHVGGARTAYFNWLFARQHGGAFVLRVEDTDVQRSTPESEAGVLRDLAWLGLDWDEGPDVGGPYGPYRQSERLEIYAGHAADLVARDLAYPCFCTDQELEERRQTALAAGRPPHYDGRCRRLDPSGRATQRAAGRAESIRFAVPDREWILNDLVRGEVRFPAGMVGDFVVLRSNRLPTYNFACVVDDHGMRFTHVIRAEEHLANTPRQLMLYDALGWEPPRFAHVPLILNRDRTKMSKRAGEAAVAVGDWRRAGYVPEALMSYLALLGFHPGDDREILTRTELLQAFTLERVGSSGSVFDPDKLRWMNAHFLHHASGAELLAWIERELGMDEPSDWADAWRRLTPGVARETQERGLELIRGNITTLAEAPGELSVQLLDPPLQNLEPEAAAILAEPRAAEVCEALAETLETLAEWRSDTIKSAILGVGERLRLKGRSLYQPIRVALTGRTHGPELPLIVEFKGKPSARLDLQEAAAFSRRRTAS